VLLLGSYASLFWLLAAALVAVTAAVALTGTELRRRVPTREKPARAS
jgi:hypothetical protein